MNITDMKVDPDELIVKDKLESIFEVQKKLKEKYDPIERSKGLHVPVLPICIDKCKTQDYLKGQIYRIVAELVEAGECLKNKPWKQTEMITDVDHLKEELADALHFFIEFCITCGIDANELFTLYLKKSKVNKWRIVTNY